MLDSLKAGVLCFVYEFKHIAQCPVQNMVPSSSPSHHPSTVSLSQIPAPLTTFLLISIAFAYFVSFSLMNIRSMESETFANNRFFLNICLKMSKWMFMINTYWRNCCMMTSGCLSKIVSWRSPSMYFVVSGDGYTTLYAFSVEELLFSNAISPMSFPSYESWIENQKKQLGQSHTGVVGKERLKQ